MEGGLMRSRRLMLLLLPPLKGVPCKLPGKVGI
jgi:hypothetical protein